MIRIKGKGGKKKGRDSELKELINNINDHKNP